jgi:radical SAM protein with 4Fe4S-binding SPASM domain
MKAEIGIRKSEYRTDLGTVVPLGTPYVLFVDPSSACNFACTFCPTGDLDLIKSIGRHQGTLPFVDFEKIVNDASEFPDKFKVLRLYKDGEPLVNKRLPKMIKLAKDSKLFNLVDTTTNGALLKKNTSEDLIESGIDLINISIDGLDSEQLLHFAKVKIDYSEFVENIKYLYEIKGNCKIVVKTTSEIIGKNREQEFFDIFGNFSDKIFVENTSPCWPNFDVEERMDISITKGLYGNEIIEQTACPYIFYSISINSDMKVSACFVDWARDLIIGDLRINSLKDIWESKELNAHRLAHLSGRRKEHKTCGGCGQISHCGPDSIEKDLLQIKSKFEENGHFENLDETIKSVGYINRRLPIVT